MTVLANYRIKIFEEMKRPTEENPDPTASKRSRGLDEEVDAVQEFRKSAILLQLKTQKRATLALEKQLSAQKQQLLAKDEALAQSGRSWTSLLAAVDLVLPADALLSPENASMLAKALIAGSNDTWNALNERLAAVVVDRIKAIHGSGFD